MSKASSKRAKIAMPSVAEDKLITASAKANPDAQPLTSEQLKAMVPMQRLRWRPKSEHKKRLVLIRYSPEVLSYFKATREGWQSRMDSVLKEYVTKRARRTTSKS